MIVACSHSTGLQQSRGEGTGGADSADKHVADILESMEEQLLVEILHKEFQALAEGDTNGRRAPASGRE